VNCLCASEQRRGSVEDPSKVLDCADVENSHKTCRIGGDDQILRRGSQDRRYLLNALWSKTVYRPLNQ